MHQQKERLAIYASWIYSDYLDINIWTRSDKTARGSNLRDAGAPLSHNSVYMQCGFVCEETVYHFQTL